jgi:alpha-tubulin suppressor-like RCC1 family protein
MSAHVRPRLAVFALVVVGMVALPLAGKVTSSRAAPIKHAPTKGKLIVHLTASRLAPTQASEIAFNYRFRRPSTTFSYLLERKQSSGWITLRSIKLKGRLKGVHNSTVKRLFGRRAITAGRYRLRLSSDQNSVTLRFTVFAAEPVKGATGISAGGSSTCALVAYGGIDCWGFNGDGELGNGTMANSSTPVAVSGIIGATSVNTGYKHTCALIGSGSVSCWGANEVGELGNGTLASSSTPVAVSALSGVVANSSGAAHTCAVLTDGTVYCWGDNEVGELGLGVLNQVAPYGLSSPEQVIGISNAVGVSAGFLHTCVLISGGSIECWGYNADGQVGNNTVTAVRPHAEPFPVHVVGITDALAISAGNFHTCALIADGKVKCWGYIVPSDLVADELLNSPVPQQTAGIEHAIAISSGAVHTCALIAGGTVKCWGANEYGQLGDGTTQDSAKPVTVVGIRNAVSISSGGFHSCAVLTGGAVKCWGANDQGELGTGTLTASSVPISVVRPLSALPR